MIWGLFLGGTDPSLTPLRPFGPNIKLDGIDIDNEVPAYSRYIPELVKALRTEFTADPSKRYYLSAAPQCPRPDQSIPMPQIIPDLDWVFVQFYNNPSCNLNAGTGFLNSLRAWSQDLILASGGSPPTPPPTTPPPSNGRVTYLVGPPIQANTRPGPPMPPRVIVTNQSSTPAPSTPQPQSGGPSLFIGVLAAPGSGYVDVPGLKSILDQVMGLNIPNLGGVMYWDGAYQALSGGNGGQTYAQMVRQTLA